MLAHNTSVKTGSKSKEEDKKLFHELLIISYSEYEKKGINLKEIYAVMVVLKERWHEQC
jgi:hypothetical protein